jgi:hypothetical protein
MVRPSEGAAAGVDALGSGCQGICSLTASSGISWLSAAQNLC